jgi:hypothetical protein
VELRICNERSLCVPVHQATSTRRRRLAEQDSKRHRADRLIAAGVTCLGG